MSAGSTESERIVQVAAMHAQIGRAVEALRHGQLARDLAAVPDAVEMRARRERCAAQPRPRRRSGAAPSSSWASSGCRRRCAQSRAPARRPAHPCRARRSVAAAARPPMPAPTMASESFFWPMCESYIAESTLGAEHATRARPVFLTLARASDLLIREKLLWEDDFSRDGGCIASTWDIFFQRWRCAPNLVAASTARSQTERV